MKHMAVLSAGSKCLQCTCGTLYTRPVMQRFLHCNCRRSLTHAMKQIYQCYSGCMQTPPSVSSSCLADMTGTLAYLRWTRRFRCCRIHILTGIGIVRRNQLDMKGTMRGQ